ncbi:MAG: hypothetical protein IKT00_11320 [Prevotella sp.]|nr:hypothetical protein [Prevotella sp.]
MMRKVAILRDESYSPHCVEKDRAILEEVARRMDIGEIIGEKELMGAEGRFNDYSLFLSMGRLPQTLSFLTRMMRKGAVVINRPQGVANCSRTVWQRVMREMHGPLPPDNGSFGHWVKRGDGAAQTVDDVVFVPDGESVDECVERFRKRGVMQVTVSAHVPGDVVKFYGVARTVFFRCCYPTDDGDSKFSLERINGCAHHYNFDEGRMKMMAERLATALGVDVFGGDCIVSEDGNFFFIDFNDWPSFSRFKDDAAEAIAEMATRRLEMNIK